MHKYGLRAIGLALMAALGLMAFASVAQAAEELTLHSRHTAILRKNGTFVAPGTKLGITGVQSGPGHLLVPGKNLDIECATGELSEATVENIEDNAEEIGEKSEKSQSGTKTDGMGRVTFGSCVVKLSGVKSEPCTKAFNEHNNGGKPTATGLILTALHLHKSTIAGEVLNSHLLIVRIKQLKGATNFITLEFGGTCSLPAKVSVSGSVAGEIPMGFEEATEDKVEQTINFESDKPLGKILNALPLIEAKLLFGEVPAFLDGTIKVKLSTGEAFGAM